MRKTILSIAAAGAAFTAAAPAAAQYYPVPQPAPYGYNSYGNGFQGNWGEVRSLQARIDNIERQIRRMDRGDRIGDGRANRLLGEAERLEQRLRWQAQGGLNPWEARDIRFRVDRLEQQVRYSVAYGYGYGRDRDDRWNRDGRRWGDRDRDERRGDRDRDERWGDRDRD